MICEYKVVNMHSDNLAVKRVKIEYNRISCTVQTDLFTLFPKPEQRNDRISLWSGERRNIHNHIKWK